MNEPKLKSYIVTEIEFDFDDGNDMEIMVSVMKNKLQCKIMFSVFGLPMMMNT